MSSLPKRTPRKRSKNPTAAAPTANPKQASAAAVPTTNPNQAGAAAASTTNPKQASAAAAKTTNPKQAGAAAVTTTNPKQAGAAAAPTTNPKQAGAAAAPTTNPKQASAAAAKTTNPNQAGAAAVTTTNPNQAGAAAAPTTNPNPNQSSSIPNSRQWEEWVDKAKKKKWDQWSFKPNPTGAIIPNTPSLFCKLHDDLANVTPVDSVYAQTPCSLLENRRFNLKLDRGYFVHSQRKLDAKGDTVRKISRSTATWKNTDGWKMVVGENGEAVGMSFNLVYYYKGRKGMWSAVEYVSINNLDGASSIVVLTCKDQTWVDLECDVEKAEHNLARSYQNLMDAKHDQRKASNIPNLEDSVRDNLAILGSKIEQLEVQRRRLKESEVMLSGVVGAENQGVQPPNIEQVGDVAAPTNIGSVTAGTEMVRNVVVTSSCRDVPSAVIERDHGASGYFSVLSNKKETKEKRKSEKAEKEKAEKAEKEKAEKEKAEKEKAEKAEAEKAEAEKAEKEKAEAEKAEAEKAEKEKAEKENAEKEK